MVENFSKTYQTARSQIRHGYLLALVLCVIALILFVLPESSALPKEQQGLGAGLIFLFGLGAGFLTWRKARVGTMRLRLDGQGVYLVDWGLVLPWAVIKSINTTGSRMQLYITLTLQDKDHFLASLDETVRAKITKNRLFRHGAFFIPAGAIEAHPGELIEAIRDGYGIFVDKV